MHPKKLQNVPKLHSKSKTPDAFLLVKTCKQPVQALLGPKSVQDLLGKSSCFCRQQEKNHSILSTILSTTYVCKLAPLFICSKRWETIKSKLLINKCKFCTPFLVPSCVFPVRQVKTLCENFNLAFTISFKCCGFQARVTFGGVRSSKLLFQGSVSFILLLFYPTNLFKFWGTGNLRSSGPTTVRSFARQVQEPEEARYLPCGRQ